MIADDDALLSPATLAQLRRLEAVRPGILTDIFKRFIEDGETRVHTIEDAPDDDLDLIAATAHSLKGSSGTIGAIEVARIAGLIEKEARAGTSPKAHIPDLRAAFTEVIPLLEKLADL